MVFPWKMFLLGLLLGILKLYMHSLSKNAIKGIMETNEIVAFSLNLSRERLFMIICVCVVS